MPSKLLSCLKTQTEAVSDCQLRQLEAMLDNHYHSIGQGHLSARAVNEVS